MKKFFAIMTIWLVGMEVIAQEDKKVSIDVNADIVSSYVWRGMYQTGVSIQPSLSLSAYGITLGAWGSTDFSTYAKEIDFYLNYQIKGLALGVTDYWWSGEGSSYFTNGSNHFIEGTVGYEFCEKFPLSLSWSTMVYAPLDKNDKNKQQYSTYIQAQYPFSVKGVDLKAGIAVTPWKGMYAKKFDVCSISLRATKELPLSGTFKLPIYVETIFAPAQDNVYLVFGLTL